VTAIEIILFYFVKRNRKVHSKHFKKLIVKKQKYLLNRTLSLGLFFNS